MIISKYATVKWNPANIKRYTELGYKYTKKGDEFEVKIEHLSNGSRSLVDYYCDYCGKIITTAYKEYLHRNKDIVDKDACENCISLKDAESVQIKYGVPCIFNLDENKEKAKQSIIDKYGVTNVGYIQKFVDKAKQTNIDKYGDNYAIERKEKAEVTMLKRYGKKSLPTCGENHYNWKGGVTPENHIGRTSIEYYEWRNAVFKRDKYTCQCCNKVGGTLHSHHLNGWNMFIEQRYDVGNGILLCEECHIEFHKLYGSGNNTKEQFDDFMANIKRV